MDLVQTMLLEQKTKTSKSIKKGVSYYHELYIMCSNLKNKQ